MLKEFDDAKDTDKLTSWETRNKKYIQQLAMHKKQAQLQSQKAAEQEQIRKLRLSRRVLGTSFQRLYPQNAAALSRSLEAGGSNNSASDNDAGGGASAGPGGEHGPKLMRCDSHSQIPKLPPLTDVGDGTGAADGSSATASGVPAADDQQRHNAGAGNQAAVDGAGGSIGAAGNGGGSGAAAAQPYPVRPSLQMRVGGGVTRRAPNRPSRSVSARGADAPPYVSESSGLGGGGGAGNQTRNLQQQQQQLQQQHYSHRHQAHSQVGQSQNFRSRRRRSTFPDPSHMRSVRMAIAAADNDPNDINVGVNAEDGGDDDDGDEPDVTISDRRTARHADHRKAFRPLAGVSHSLQSQSQSQAPMLAVAARTPSRLTAAASSLPPTPAGYTQWRMRARLPEGQRAFCIAGSGNHSQGIRAGLLARGWYENPDRNSQFFDFKWAANPLDINHDTLWPGQIVNHFRHSTCLTTKHGLCYTVRDTVWYEAADAAAFYPRAYDITDENSRRDFLQDVRWTAAEALIKRALIDGAICMTYVPYNPRRKSSNINSQTQQQEHAKAAAGNASSGGGGGGVSEDGETPPPPQPGDDSGDNGGGGGGEDDDDDHHHHHRLQQVVDSTPLVDLPSLRLACMAVAARLRQQRHLRVVHESNGSGGGAAAAAGRGGGGGRSACEDLDGPGPEVELSFALWQQLVKHRALSCSAPVLPQPQFDPSWIQSRSFITSALLPQTAGAPGRAKRSGGGGGGGSISGRGIKAPRKGRDVQGRSRRHRGGGGGSGTRTDGEAGGGGSGSEGAEGDESDAGGAGGRPSASTSFLVPGDEREAEGDADARFTAAAAVAVHPGGGGAAASSSVPVVDAAELLREVYGKARRRHSAPPLHRGSKGGSAAVTAVAAAGGHPGSETRGSDGLASSISTHISTNPSPPRSRKDADVSSGGDDGGGIAFIGPSWLPEDLPPICYDNAALQALDFNTWRPAAAAILSALESSAVQTHISGTNNIWIAKPAGKSRGRGIRLFNDPDALLSYIRGEEAQGLESRWIAQKYVERPLIISRRKFDIRQWVLVTDWNPLQAWFYSTCYLRFAADDYDPNNLDIYQHLTNNSVSKYFEGPKKEDEITASGNMWSIPRFQQWLAEVYGRDDIWQLLLQPAMRHIAICTLKSAQDHITARKGSCQLYGYDFLIDDQLRVWLLEVNSSPTMEPSTPITAELCADVQEDILKVVIDLPDQLTAAARRAACGGGEQTVDEPGTAADFDTGKWACIIDGGEELRQPQYTGLNLELKGRAIQLPPPRSNLAGRLYAAARQQQQVPQLHHQPSLGPSEEVPKCSSGGGSGDGPASSNRRAAAGQGPAANAAAATVAVVGALVPALSSPSQVTTPRTASLSSCPATALDLTERQQHQLQQQQQQLLQQPYYQLLQQQQQMLLHYQQRQQLAVDAGEDDPAAAAGGTAAVLMARAHTGRTPPSSRGGSRASPMRCRTPRLSVSPGSALAAAHLRDAGGFFLGSFGDPSAALSTSSPRSAGGPGSRSPLHPPSAPRILTPRGDLAIGGLSMGTPAAAATAAAAAAAAAAAPLWLPLSPPTSHSLGSLTPTTVRMPLFARPGHQGAAAGLTPTGVKA